MTNLENATDSAGKITTRSDYRMVEEGAGLKELRNKTSKGSPILGVKKSGIQAGKNYLNADQESKAAKDKGGHGLIRERGEGRRYHTRHKGFLPKTEDPGFA